MAIWNVVVRAEARTRAEAEENAGISLSSGLEAHEVTMVQADPPPDGVGALWERAFALPHAIASLGSEACQVEWDGSPWWSDRAIALRAESGMGSVVAKRTRPLHRACDRRDILILWGEAWDDLERGRRFARSVDGSRLVDVRYVEAVEACAEVTWWGGDDREGPVEARDTDGRVVALLMPCRDGLPK